MHAALLGPLTVDGVRHFAALHGGDRGFLAGNDPEEDVAAHRCRDHCPDMQEGGAPGEQVGQHVGDGNHEDEVERREEQQATLHQQPAQAS